MTRLDNDEGWLYKGVSIVRRFVAGGDLRGFWIFLTPDGYDDDTRRYFTLKEAKKAVDDAPRTSQAS